MYPTHEIGRERITDLVRDGDRERRSRPIAHARAVERRARFRGRVNLVVGTFALARRKRVVRPA